MMDMHAAASGVAGPGPAPESRIVATELGDVGIREWGLDRRPTVVLLHGISSGSASWSECAALIASRAHVVAWDAPGYGLSAPLPMDRPMADDYADRLDALLDALNIEDCLLVGHSLGALMAAAYASRRPSKALALLLISPALGYGGKALRHKAQEVRDKRLQALRRDGIAAMAAALPHRLLSEQASPAQRGLITEVASRLSAGGYSQAVEMLCAEDMDRFDLSPSTARVYCGELDVVTTPRQSAEFARRAGLPFDLIDGAGHACYVEQAQRVADIVFRCLDTVAPMTGADTRSRGNNDRP